MALPLKMFILGVPSHNLVARVLIRHPTSSSGWGGQWVKVAVLWVPILFLLGRWPPHHPHWGSHLLSVLQQPTGGFLGGIFNSVLPPFGGPPLTALTGHPQGPQGPFGFGMGPSHLGGVTRGWLGNLLPVWGQRLGVRWSSISPSYISPQMCSWGRRGTKFNRFLMPSHGLGDPTSHSHHFITIMEQNDQFHCQ